MIFLGAHLYSQEKPKREVRAVWLTTVDYLDWPKMEMHNNTELQKKSLLGILENLKKNNINTIFFQVRPRGNTFYKSKYEPWAKELTGELGKDPGWDPLEFILREAHKRGMEVHAWMNMMKVWSNPKLPSQTTPNHIINRKPQWVKMEKNEWWLDFGIPSCREYMNEVVIEVVKNYDIDGIHFDYLRYPGKNFNDDDSYGIYSRNQKKPDWRRDNITLFLRKVYHEINKIKPGVKIGVAPIGIYKNLPGMTGLSSYDNVYQDTKRWLDEKIIDYIAPQTYWDLEITKHDPGFELCIKEWAKNKNGRQMYPGIFISSDKIKKEVNKQIVTLRQNNSEGFSFYRYSDIENTILLKNILNCPANINPMSWKDSIPPNPPANLFISKTEDGYMLKWVAPKPANDKDTAKFYNIYRSMDDKFNKDNPFYLIATIGADKHEYPDIISNPNTNKPLYFVSALDKGNNESGLCAEMKPIAKENNTKVSDSIEIKPDNRINLINQVPDTSDSGIFYKKLFTSKPYITCFPEEFETYSLIGYELFGQYYVNLGVYSYDGKEVLNILKGTQSPGKYIVKLFGKYLKPGNYVCRIKFGNKILDKYITKK
jgi:uncharacterized lipoprotein YddW (UPF0748 family)